MIEDMIFIISKKEQKKMPKCCPKCKQIRWHYIFTPTGIGNNITIKCCICGKEKDITDYECW